MTRAELEAKIKADPHFQLVREEGAGVVIPGAQKAVYNVHNLADCEDTETSR
jgi:hypothetical protein